MNKKELVDKIVHWMLIYIDHNKRLPLRDVIGEVQLQISHLAVSLNKSSIAQGARMIEESRTTLSERLRLKGDISNEELKEICDKHGVDFYPRIKNEGWIDPRKRAMAEKLWKIDDNPKNKSAAEVSKNLIGEDSD